MTEDPQIPQPSERALSPVQVLGRAADLLRVLSAAPGGLTQAEIANRLGLARTTVHRIASALAAERLIELRGNSNRYRLGAEILRLADIERSARVSDVHAHLRALSAEIDETVDLSVMDRAQVLFIDQVVAQHRLRAVSGVGAHFAAYCTAPGKAMLATMSVAEVNRLIPEKLEAFTPRTITSLARLHEDLERTRQRGYALDLEEHTLGISAVGVALDGTVLGVACVSVPIPAQRFAEKRERALVSLQRMARNVEQDLTAAGRPE